MAYIPQDLIDIDLENVESLKYYLMRELRSIKEALDLLETEGVHMRILPVAINKPRYGLLAMSAAGVLGANEGLYRYDSGGSWVYIG
jgi:hypothetical protein